jgi:hypothetical protein
MTSYEMGYDDGFEIRLLNTAWLLKLSAEEAASYRRGHRAGCVARMRWEVMQRARKAAFDAANRKHPLPLSGAQ